MPHDSFQLECDRLSQIVDLALSQRLLWERNEGPMLARLVALAHAAFEGRSEFELVEEGATRDLKRFVLKIHGKRVMAVSLRIADGQAVIEDLGSKNGTWVGPVEVTGPTPLRNGDEIRLGSLVVTVYAAGNFVTTETIERPQ